MALQKKALLVAPAYNALPDDMHLPGTTKDIAAIKDILLKKFAFKDIDIKVLQGNDATKDKLVQALNNLASEAQDESVVFLYYSGHGIYLPDSQDEGLLPTVSTWPATQPAEEVCFTGQDFAPFLESLAKKKVKCTFIFDCCHSGQLYRVTEFEASGLRPKQVIFKKAEVSASKTKQSEYTKAHRGGWTPEDNDHFVHIAACTTVQVAAEEIGKGGRLTMAIENVINSLSAPGNVSYEAFFRLISKEFKKRGWDQRQTPQIEGANRDTVLFGTSKVIPLAGGILVKDVPSKEEVVLDAGYLQSLSSGEYNVFETTASEDSVKQGTKSKDLLASIDINEGNIETAQAFGSVVCRQEGKEITHGCLAYLKTPGSIKTNVFIADQVPKHSDDLLQQLKGTNMLNVLPQTPSTQDPDLTTITKEEIKDKMCWVARRRGNVIVPPVSLGREEVMASNLCRHSRFQIALERAKSPTDREEVLGNVSLKVSKLEKVQPYRSKRSKIQRTQEALKGTDISAVRDQRPSFQAHSVIEGTTRLQDRTGDAFAFEVTNHNAKPEDTVHICILFYQFDGRIAALYPKKTGRTIELRGGDTAEDIFKLYIPEGSLRTMAEPDPSKVEPNMGIDTLVLYAASGSVDFGPIVQSAIETDPDILDRGDVDTDPLSDLKKFIAVNNRNVSEDELQEDLKLFVKKVEFAVVK